MEKSQFPLEASVKPPPHQVPLLVSFPVRQCWEADKHLLASLTLSSLEGELGILKLCSMMYLYTKRQKVVTSICKYQKRFHRKSEH